MRGTGSSIRSLTALRTTIHGRSSIFRPWSNLVRQTTHVRRGVVVGFGPVGIVLDIGPSVDEEDMIDRTLIPWERAVISWSAK